MATGAENYLGLVKQAYQGDLKLPAFQREFKWTRKQVIRLYDSIRQSYPVGSIIVLEGSKSELKERSFRGAADDAEGKSTKRLVLDGQQRLTAGVDLFFGESLESISQYFIDIDKLISLVLEKSINIDDDIDIRKFLSDLDDDDGYCVGRARVDNPYALLNARHLLSTTLLRPDNSKKRDHYLEEYEEKFPDRKNIVRNIVKPYFVINEAPDIPYVSIDSSLQLDSISRIFSTLNSSGKVLTPFELVVAVLFSSGIDLRDDLDIIKEEPYIRNMDSSGEIVLQTVVMLCGKNQKKSLLPKNLEAGEWMKLQDKATALLVQVGKFFTDHCGMSLDITSDIVPYDSIFVPMAIVFDKIKYSELSPANLGSVNTKLTQWFVGSALSQRYQEGVHNKQVNDVTEMTNWIVEGTDDYKPGWLKDVVVPSLRLVTTKGAVSNLLRCIINQHIISDPLTGGPVNFGLANTHSHHIFPTKYVEKLPGWNQKAGDKSDLFLNLMQLTSSTNISFLNDDPRLQIQGSVNARGLSSVQESYERQGIPADAFAILQKPEKTRDDFHNFLKIRETALEQRMSNWGFARSGGLELVDETEAG